MHVTGKTNQGRKKNNKRKGRKGEDRSRRIVT